jgi:endo-1,4-beta-xylanase
MVAFSNLVVTLFVAAGSLASPAAEVKRADDSLANFVLGRDSPLQRRSSVNYKQDYTTGGDVSFSTDGNYFSVNWDTSDDFVVGLGWTPGSTS